MVDLARLEATLHRLNVVLWCVRVLRPSLPLPSTFFKPVPFSQGRPFCRLRRSYEFYYLATPTTSDPASGAQAESRAGVVMVRKEDVYRAYVATCQAEGWPTRYTRQTLGKAVKRVFPLVSTRRLGSRHCVKQYYMGLCPQLQQQPQLRRWSTANANNNNNNNCGDCWVDNRATRQACSSGGGVHDCQQHLLRNLSHPSPCQGSSGGGGDYDSTPPTPDLSTQQDDSVTPSAAPLHPLPSSQLMETSGPSSPSATAWERDKGQRYWGKQSPWREEGGRDAHIRLSAPHGGPAIDNSMTQRLQRPRPPTGDYGPAGVMSTGAVDAGEAELSTRRMPGQGTCERLWAQEKPHRLLEWASLIIEVPSSFRD